MNQKMAVFLCGLFLLFGIFNVLGQVASAAPARTVIGQNIAQLPVCLTEDQFKEVLYRHLMNRDTEFQIVYQGDGAGLYGDDPEELFDEIWRMDQPTSDDFDYLHYSIKEYVLEADPVEDKTLFRFHIAYYESAEQLAKTNTTVEKALKNLRLSQDSEAVKVRKIHDDLLIQHHYDQGQGKDSAYDALLNKEASSRGYALATYKMLTAAGIPCRIVAGKTGGNIHFWNIIQLDEKWYSLDNALDISNHPIISVRYDYFLVGTDKIGKDHQLAESHQVVEFESDYPLSAVDYPGRNKLILASDAERTKAKIGVGQFNEAYHHLSNLTVDSFEKINDRISDGALDVLSGVFRGI